MDYKYIEQLLERYWECQTTLDEEAILRTFFRQEDVPASLLPYRRLFIEEDKMASEHLSEDFKNRMLHLVGEDGTLPFGDGMGAGFCKARRITVMRRLRPFYRAAGLVAILLTIGNAAQQSFIDDGLTPDSTQKKAEIMVNAQWTMVNDSIESKPEQQSAELSKPITDTLNALTR